MYKVSQSDERGGMFLSFLPRTHPMPLLRLESWEKGCLGGQICQGYYSQRPAQFEGSIIMSYCEYSIAVKGKKKKTT